MEVIGNQFPQVQTKNILTAVQKGKVWLWEDPSPWYLLLGPWQALCLLNCKEGVKRET